MLYEKPRTISCHQSHHLYITCVCVFIGRTPSVTARDKDDDNPEQGLPIETIFL